MGPAPLAEPLPLLNHTSTLAQLTTSSRMQLMLSLRLLPLNLLDEPGAHIGVRDMNFAGLRVINKTVQVESKWPHSSLRAVVGIVAIAVLCAAMLHVYYCCC